MSKSSTTTLSLGPGPLLSTQQGEGKKNILPYPDIRERAWIKAILLYASMPKSSSKSTTIFIPSVDNLKHFGSSPTYIAISQGFSYPDGPGIIPGGTIPGTTGAMPGMIIGGGMPGNIIPPIWSKRGFLATGSSSMRPGRGEEKKGQGELKREEYKNV